MFYVDRKEKFMIAGEFVMKFNRVDLMLDCSRNAVRTVSTVKKFVDIMSEK